MDEAEARGILDFWLDEVGPAGWWTRSATVDAAIADRFATLWERERHRPADAFLGSASRAFAAVLLFDQYGRNLFREDARAFASDDLARAVARAMVARGLDREIAAAPRIFVYMPFMHSEEMADQLWSLALFEALGDDNSLDNAREHHAMIARFGRFPHRNAALGRADRPGEAEAIAQGGQW
ncbi:DUF924 family protein [Flavisphingomonas formosensis]|uniref:DUF924 family protein n=1 Tax=Flavisphingomonas formosensis TaxID=861534 RepID=UPI0012F709AA|nr:DUF924 family protein [Sphingomonas formosensis]